MKKRIEVVLTEEQDKVLIQKTKNAGFAHKGEYVRFILFLDIYFGEKIHDLFQKVIR